MTTFSHAPNGKLKTNPGPRKQFWLKRLCAHWDTALDALIPTGYENNAGFHYGSAPAMGDIHPQNLQRTAK